MLIALIILSLLALFTVVAPHIPGKHWLIRVWEFPRVQLLVSFLILMIAWAGLIGLSAPLSMLFFGLLGLGILYEALWIIPYTPLWRTEVANATDSGSRQATLSVLTSNVYMHNKNYQGLLDLVAQHQPDMLITLESNQDWQQALSGLHEHYPHRLACPLENLYGMHLYSRLPFKSSELRYIVEDDVPSMQITVNLNNQDIIVYFLHPKPPSPTENETAGPRDAELAKVGKEIVQHRVPVIVAGDLNDVAWSPTTRHFRQLSGALDPRIGRGFFNTFHAKYPFIRWPLDHVFHTRHFSLISIERLPGYGSDHFPLLTRLQLNPAPSPDAFSSARQTEK